MGLGFCYHMIPRMSRSRKGGAIMSYWDDVGNLADEMWLIDELTGGGGGGGGGKGGPGCSAGFLKLLFIVVVIYAVLKFIFG